uniref:Uncharacterized protein n=1 Tax=Magnetococcus massalia (strain MO-1) TaxID=451514 RepID=A0A1S7LEE4_MAGMO|nr:Conserved protein of unknown function [Candidatus Magnetococcus massalia]
MTFGFKGTEINNYQQAVDTPESFCNRIEAVCYWEDIKEVGEETAHHGEIAKEAIAAGNMEKAKHHVFYALYEERKIIASGSTWGPVFDAIK